jgi:hypothetical protein
MVENFPLAEYKMLRDKAQDVIRRIEELERNVIIACSAIFVFSNANFKSDNKYQNMLLFSLPFFLSLIGFYRYKGFTLYLREINEYTMRLEEKLNDGKPGWLSYYYSNDRHYTDKHYKSYRIWIWYAVVTFNVVAGLSLAVPLLAGK